MIPTISVVDKDENELKSYNLPVDAHIIIKDGDGISSGDVMVKIPRKSGKSGDITGGLQSLRCLKLEILPILLLFLKLMVLHLMEKSKEVTLLLKLKRAVKSILFLFQDTSSSGK